MTAGPQGRRAAPGALVFDLDGTLIDSRRDLAAAINRTRRDFELPPLELEAVVALVGEGAAKLVAAAAKEVGRDRVPEALERFFAHYGEVLLDTTRLYPGVEAMIAVLQRRFPLAVLTNKPEGFSRAILAGLGLAGRFREIVGGDTLPERKPDPAGLAEIGRRLGVPETAGLLLVGDSGVDAATARAAGAPFAFVTWGFAAAEERAALEGEGGAELVVRHPAELVAALDRWGEA